MSRPGAESRQVCSGPQALSGTPSASTPHGGSPGRAARMRIPSIMLQMAIGITRIPQLDESLARVAEVEVVDPEGSEEQRQDAGGHLRLARVGRRTVTGVGPVSGWCAVSGTVARRWTVAALLAVSRLCVETGLPGVGRVLTTRVLPLGGARRKRRHIRLRAHGIVGIGWITHVFTARLEKSGNGCECSGHDPAGTGCTSWTRHRTGTETASGSEIDLRRRPESGLDFRTHLGRTSTGATRV